MPSRRDLIRMSDAELSAFLAGPGQGMNVASVAADGRPHLVAMWYGFFADGDLGFWTFGKSQKVVNLRRDPRVTCLVEAGDGYSDLRGAEIIGTATVSSDRESLLEIGRSVMSRYPPPGSAPIDPVTFTDDVVEQMAAKRVAVRITVERIVSWDHRKLAGVY